MSKIEKISVALPSEMVAAIRAAVESGDYATNSDVMRDALRDWQIKRHIEDANTAELRRLVQEGIDSLDRGEGIPAEEVFARLKERYSAMAKKAEKETA
jgi:antitoxin ParD1/3/4